MLDRKGGRHLLHGNRFPDIICRIRFFAGPAIPFMFFISGIGMNVILCDSLHTDICICGLFFESCNEILLCKQNSL